VKHSYLLIAAISGLAVSCGSNEPRKSVPEMPAVSVRTVEVASVNWPADYQVTGTVQARVTSTLSSKVMATVEQVTVQAGDHVTAGQFLIGLDARDLDTSLQRAQAVQAQAVSAVPEAANAVSAAKANLDLADITLKRMEKLAEQRSVTKQELDEAKAKQMSAQAAYEMATARQQQSEARVKEAEQAVLAATLMRNDTKINAPFAGVVIAKTTQPGDLARPGTPLLTLEQAGGYRLEVNVDESRLSSVLAGTRVQIAVDGRGCEGLARVSEVMPTVDPQSRSYVVKVDLPPMDEAGRAKACGALRSGMFGQATFAQGDRGVIAIPASAVRENGQLQSVFVVEGGRAHTRMITTGDRHGSDVAVLSGLQPGERVVTPIPQLLADGALIGSAP
jgi:RND family efflux transporter MFP subunit